MYRPKQKYNVPVRGRIEDSQTTLISIHSEYENDPATLPDTKRYTYTELISDHVSWAEWGARFLSSTPRVPGKCSVPMMEPLTLQVELEFKKPLALRDVHVFAWHNLYTEHNTSGRHAATPLAYVAGSRGWDDVGRTWYTFRASVHPTDTGDYSLTFYVVLKGRRIMWADKYMDDCKITILPPEDPENKEGMILQVGNHLWIGDMYAVTTAEDDQYECIIGLDKKILGQMTTGVKHDMAVHSFSYTPLPIGASNVIPPRELMNMLRMMNESIRVKSKVFVGSRLGRGRAASLAIAYIYAVNCSLTFQEAVDLVRKDCGLCYYHKGLEEQLKLSFPRH